MNTSSTATPPGLEAAPSPHGVVSSGWLASNSMFGSEDKRAKRAFGASLATVLLHSFFLLLAFLALAYHAQQAVTPEPTPETHVVFLQQAGPGGGGGGSPAPAPAKALSIPKTKAPDPIPITPLPQTVPPPPAPTLTAPIITTNASAVQASGTSSVSLSPYGGGGRGGGIGSGTGSGVGPGTGGGFGGGAFRPGAGITMPVPLRQPPPVYTPDAMRMKIVGAIDVEAVVLADGTVGDVRILKSLDRTYGMDQAALAAAKQWTFRPARDREGNAVPIIVLIGFDLRIH
ncbi:MAG: energy transducer TonB [Vicinamibacterales bacterium]